MIRIMYHGSCYDGYGSAFSAFIKYEREGRLDDVIFRPCYYGEKDKPLEEVEDGDEVFVLDFSFSREGLIKLAERPGLGGLLVIDHHEGKKAEIEDLPFVNFDLEHSGAYSSWLYFNPSPEGVPEMLRYIEDRDLWRFKMPLAHEVHCALLSYPMEFRVWKTLMDSMDLLKSEGIALKRMMDQQVKVLCSKAKVQTIGGHAVPVTNTSVYFSEVCHELLNLYPESPFAAYYYDYWLESKQTWLRQWGLRSRGDFDVAEMARRFGGNGHKSASGFEQTLEFRDL